MAISMVTVEAVAVAVAVAGWLSEKMSVSVGPQ